MIWGTIAWVLGIGTYFGALAAAVCAAIAMTLSARGRIAILCWGLVAWMLTAPILWIVLYVPIEWNGIDRDTPELGPPRWIA